MPKSQPMVTAEYWFLLPIGAAIATIYTSTGISGANFWVPIYLVWLRLDPSVAFWLALVSMLFGSLSGLLAHTRQNTIHYALAGRYLLFTVPLAALASWGSHFAPPDRLIGIFGGFVLAYGLVLLSKARSAASATAYSTSNLAWPAAALGALGTGLISVGLGALLLPKAMRHREFKHHVEAVGSVVLIVFVSSLAAVLVRLRPAFVESLNTSRGVVLSVLLFVIPGVLVGGWIGPWLAQRLEARSMRLYLALVLVLIGGGLLWRSFIARTG